MTSTMVLQAAGEAGLVRPLDIHFARLMAELAGDDDPALVAAALLASWGAGSGDVCVDLAAHAGEAVVETAAGALTAPGLATWLARLRASPMVGRPGDSLPLILDDAGRLYLGRYWHYEAEVARLLELRRGIDAGPFAPDRAAAALARLFPAARGTTDWQQVAAAVACASPLTVISGGPGTGKTHTVARMLAVMQDAAAAGPLRVGLAAPTGKAAARLADAMGRVRSTLDVDPAVRQCIPERAETLHRLLGFHGPGRPRHHPGNPLHLDALVVDEASMVDLPLMYRVLGALRDDARLVLLGDRDQLASVEAGHVMGDLCAGRSGDAYGFAMARHIAALTGTDVPVADGEPGFADQVVLLRRSYRFAAASDIGRLAAAVNRGDGAGAAAVLRGDGPETAWPEMDGPGRHRWLGEFGRRHFATLGRLDPEAALEALDRARILAAVREGPWGVVALNRLLEEPLAGAGGGGPWYAGRPVMVTRNDYGLGLFNGDLGVALPADGGLRVWFRQADGALRALAPGRLPDHETAFAITVHKSQGSEFDEVCLVLPPLPSRALTRELIYTGVTRARHRLTVLADGESLFHGIGRPTARTSGLRDRLWGPAHQHGP